MARSPAAFDYGPSLGELLSGQPIGDPAVENLDLDDPDELAARSDLSKPRLMQLRLKKRQQAALMKQILKNGGYGDLARMTNIRKGEV